MEQFHIFRKSLHTLTIQKPQYFFLMQKRLSMTTTKTTDKSLFSSFFQTDVLYYWKEVRAFALSPYLRACIKLANPARKLPTATNSSMMSFIRFFCFFFFLLICLSPPYNYIIQYGIPYVKRFLLFLLTNMELSMFIYSAAMMLIPDNNYYAYCCYDNPYGPK